jgi:hypothetical protein
MGKMKLKITLILGHYVLYKKGFVSEKGILNVLLFINDFNAAIRSKKQYYQIVGLFLKAHRPYCIINGKEIVGSFKR